MLRDNNQTYNPPAPNDLSIEESYEITAILNFIDGNVAGFRPYFLAEGDSSRENRISDFLVYYFNSCLLDETSEGFPPFNFNKNPTQAKSGKETDIGVVVLTKNAKPITIIEFEAKRLSSGSNNKEYVSGERGGIERLKRLQHASHLTVCGMFGYVQDNTSLHWIQKINEHISELSQNNQDASIDWKNANEKLIKIKEFKKIHKFSSVNLRTDKSDLKIYHYFINLN